MLNPFEPPITPSVKIIGFQSTADGQVVGDYGLKAWAGLGCPVAYSLFPCRFCSRTPADGQVVGDVMGRANQAGRPGGLFALSLPFTQPHARARVAILVNEDHARGF